MQKEKYMFEILPTVVVTSNQYIGEDEIFTAIFVCPNCDEDCLFIEFNFCPNCGVKLVWEIDYNKLDELRN